MNSLSSWSQCCRMGVGQEVSHRRIVADEEAGRLLLVCRSKNAENCTASITLNIAVVAAAAHPPGQNEGIWDGLWVKGCF